MWIFPFSTAIPIVRIGLELEYYISMFLRLSKLPTFSKNCLFLQKKIWDLKKVKNHEVVIFKCFVWNMLTVKFNTNELYKFTTQQVHLNSE